MTTKLRAASFINLASDASDQNNTSTGYIHLPNGTTAQRPSNPINGMIRFNTTLGYIEEYRSDAWKAISNTLGATGGTETTYTSGGVTYKVHTFLSSGTLIVNSLGSFESLIVAGGGGGGASGGSGWRGGHGGAGGYLTSSNSSLGLSLGNNTVTVGAGGASAANGSNSILGNQTAIGGGHGGQGDYPGAGQAGNAGGSGGGGGQGYNGGGGAGGAGTSGQGFAGAAATSSPYTSGGGGGSSGTPSTGGAAGPGTSNSIRAGSPVTYASGGSGHTGSSGAGVANTGDGGQNLTAGGSGIVIIRYAIPST